jgi:hypothetical protein
MIALTQLILIDPLRKSQARRSVSQSTIVA